MHRRATGAALVAALMISLVATGCGKDEPVAATTDPGVTACREQWHEVATSIAGLDTDTYPSDLASRWTNVVATIDYYETADTSTDCQAAIEAQVDAITVLRQFNTKVRAYDMAYQAAQVATDVQAYLAAPLPASLRDAKGKVVRPPTKAAVTAALAKLDADAATANEDLSPGWGQLAALELTDDAAVASALQDLDFLAKDSASWTACKAALVVIGAALRAQLGLLPGAPLPTPTATPTATPGSDPTTTPTSGATPTGTPGTSPSADPTATP